MTLYLLHVNTKPKNDIRKRIINPLQHKKTTRSIHKNDLDKIKKSQGQKNIFTFVIYLRNYHIQSKDYDSIYHQKER